MTSSLQRPATNMKLLYYDMLRIRLVEEALANRYSEQKIRCPMHLSIGQEAIAVGACAYLKKNDIAILYAMKNETELRKKMPIFWKRKKMFIYQGLPWKSISSNVS